MPLQMNGLTDQLTDSLLPKEADHSIQSEKGARFSALVYLQSIIVGLVLMPIDYWIAGIPLTIFSFIFTGVSLFCYFTNRQARWQKLTRLLFIIVANFVILGMSQFLGPQAELQFFYAPATALPLLMFPKKEFRQMIFSIALPIVLLLLTYLLPSSPQTISPDLQPVIKLFGIACSLLATLMVATSLFYLYRLAIKNEDRLLQQSEALVLSEKMSTLGIVAAGIAHEINNPLTIIMGTARAIQKHATNSQSPPDARVVQQSDQIHQTAKRIARIVAGLKVFSRNSTKDTSSLINIHELLEQAYTLCHQKLESKSLTIDCDKDLLAFSNPTDLLQTLVNLINNSIDAQEENPNAWLKVMANQNGESVYIRVIDSGKGIPPEILQKLFTPFYTTKPVGKGTGLGLSISRKLIETRGGKLYYQLFEDHTSFVIELPVSNSKAKAA